MDRTASSPPGMRHSRWRVDARARLRGAGGEWSGRLVDLSLSGMRVVVATLRPPARGEALLAEIEGPAARCFSVAGRVVRSGPRVIALAFAPLGADAEAAVERLLGHGALLDAIDDD